MKVGRFWWRSSSWCPIWSPQGLCSGFVVAKIVSLWASNHFQARFELVSFHWRVIEITLSTQLCGDNLGVYWPSFQHLPWGAIAGRSPTLATWPLSEERCLSHPLSQERSQPIITCIRDFFSWTLVSQPYMQGNDSAPNICLGFWGFLNTHLGSKFPNQKNAH